MFRSTRIACNRFSFSAPFFSLFFSLHCRSHRLVVELFRCRLLRPKISICFVQLLFDTYISFVHIRRPAIGEMNPWMLWPFLWSARYLLETHPWLAYSLLACAIRPLFHTGLLLLLPVAMIAFKRRYTWERDGLAFSVNLAVLVLLLCPWESPFTVQKRSDLIRIGPDLSDEVEMPFASLRISSLWKWHLLALSFQTLQMMYFIN